MNRVSDAMRRAGQDLQDVDLSIEELSFAPSEESAEPPDGDAGSAAESEVVPLRSLVRMQPTHPMRVTRVNTDGEIRLTDALGTLIRRRWLVLGVVATAIAVAVAYNQRATRIYEASSRLLIEPNAPEVVPFRNVTEDQGRLDYYVTQLEVLRSRALARRTLEQLSLLSADPSKQADQANGLLGALRVSPVTSSMGDSRVINIAVTSTSPEQAARLANGVAKAYVDQNLESRRQGSREASLWLNQRLAELRQELSGSESALQKYREDKESVSLGQDQDNIIVQKLAQLNTLVTNARTERLDKEATYRQLKDVQAQGLPLDSFTPILANTFIQGLKADLATLQREHDQLAEQLGELHPDMVKVNNAIAAAKLRLSQEMAKIVAGIENDYHEAQTKEKSLFDELEEQKHEVLKLKQVSIGYGTLQRDAMTTQQMFQTVLQRVKETDLSAELQSNNARILDKAEIPNTPVWPRAQLNLVAALVGGCFFGAVLAFGADYLNPRIAMASDIAASLGLPLLGITPQIPRLKNRTALDPLPLAFQEAVRSIRTQVFLSPVPGAARSIAVTSTSSGDGKTMVASNLAVSIAMAGRRVLLVDADLRRPQLHRMFSTSRSPGLSDVMAGEAKPTDAIVETAVQGLFILPAGTRVPNPTDLLDSTRLSQMIRAFTQVFDTVILDCPPVMGVADASIIGHATSSVLLVIGSGRTSPEAARAAVDRITSVQAQVIGVVLNSAKLRPRDAHGYRELEPTTD